VEKPSHFLSLFVPCRSLQNVVSSVGPFLGSRQENEQELGSVGAEPPDNRIVDSNFISSPAANETKFVRTRQLNHHASSYIDVPKWKCRKLFYAKQMNETEECHTIVENYAGLK